jgi:hypothetical protein
MGAQNELATFREAQARNAFQRNYMYRTGTSYGGLGGTAGDSAFAGLAAATGGMWGIENAMVDLQGRQAMYGFDFQAAQVGMQSRQFMENWSAKWSRLQIQKGWTEDEQRKQDERNAAADEWWEYRWSFRRDTADIQYGRTMEDLDEGIRFATGRDKLRLLRQKARATEDYSRQRMYAGEEKEYWEQQRDWREEDIDDAREKHDQKMQWAEEDLERSKRHHEERTDMQQAHIAAQKAFWIERDNLEKTRRQLDREFWTDQQNAQAADIETSQNIAELQRQLREDQLKLTEDAQNRTALFQIAIESIGEGMDILNQRVSEFNDLVRQWDPGTWEQKQIQEPTGRGDIQHQGGPIGMAPGAGSVSILAEEGEYIVPKQGQLVFRDDDRVVGLLSRILIVLEEKAMINVITPGQNRNYAARITEAAYNSY